MREGQVGGGGGMEGGGEGRHTGRKGGGGCNARHFTLLSLIATTTDLDYLIDLP